MVEKGENYRNHFLGSLPKEPSYILIVPTLKNSAIVDQILSQYSDSQKVEAHLEEDSSSNQSEESSSNESDESSNRESKQSLKIQRAIKVLQSPPLNLKQLNQGTYKGLLILVETPGQKEEIKIKLLDEDIDNELIEIVVHPTLQFRQDTLQRLVGISLDRMKEKKQNTFEMENYLQKSYKNIYKTNQILRNLSLKGVDRDFDFAGITNRIERAQKNILYLRNLPYEHTDQSMSCPRKQLLKTPNILNDKLLEIIGKYEGNGVLELTIHNPNHFYFSNVFLITNHSKIDIISEFKIEEDTTTVKVNPLNYIQNAKLCNFRLIYNQATISNLYEFGILRISFSDNQEFIQITNHTTMQVETYPGFYSTNGSIHRGERVSVNPLETQMIPNENCEHAPNYQTFAMFDAVYNSKSRISNKLWLNNF